MSKTTAEKNRSLSGQDRRLWASPYLRTEIAAQGRRHNWMAARLGMSESQFSNILAGRRNISEADARVLAALVDGNVGDLFVLSSVMDDMTNGRSAAA